MPDCSWSNISKSTSVSSPPTAVPAKMSELEAAELLVLWYLLLSLWALLLPPLPSLCPPQFACHVCVVTTYGDDRDPVIGSDVTFVTHMFAGCCRCLGLQSWRGKHLLLTMSLGGSFVCQGSVTPDLAAFLRVLVLPPYVTWDCWWFWVSVPLLTALHLCTITTTLATVGHSSVFQRGVLWEHADDLTVRRECVDD